MKKSAKAGLIITGSLAFLVMVPPLLMPSEYTAKASIVIESTSYNVFPYIADLRNWEKWSPWKEKDPSTPYTYSSKTMGAGSTMEWSSQHDEVGQGKITTVQFKKFHHINYQLDLLQPIRNRLKGQLVTEKVNDQQVKVTWTNTGKLSWPFGRWLNTFVNFQSKLEKQLQQGLDKLKTVVELSPQKILPAVSPEKMELKDQIIFSIMHETVLNDQIGTVIGTDYQKILESIATNKAVLLEEPPLCLFYSHNELTSKMRPGLLVQGCLPLEGGDVECIPIRAGKVLRFTYLGGYSNMRPTYDAIDIYIEENKINRRENYSWESYATDPGLELDSTKWVTYIYVPVK